MDPGTVGADAATPDPGLHRRFGPQSAAKPKRFIYELQTPVHSKLPPMTGTQPVTDFRSPQRANLEDTVAQLYNEIYALKHAPPGLSTSSTWAPPARPNPAAFTTTKVPKFSKVTSWNQYRQVFDAIVRLNGLDDTPHRR